MVFEMKLMPIDRHTIRRVYYHVRHNFFTLNNAVIVIATVVAISWVWGAVSMMQRNYVLQRNLNTKERELTLAQLEVETLQYQGRYYASTEYQELSARKDLGLANPGEKLLILPENSVKAKELDAPPTTMSVEPNLTPSNFEQWLDFFAGKNAPSE